MFDIKEFKAEIKLMSFDTYKNSIVSIKRESYYYSPLKLCCMADYALKTNDVEKFQLFNSTLSYFYKRTIFWKNALTFFMTRVFSYCKSRLYLDKNNTQMRIAINKLILDYIDIRKPSLFLIKNLIKCKMFSLLSYVNALTPLINFNLGKLDDFTKKELDRYGINTNNLVQDFTENEDMYDKNGKLKLKQSLIKKISSTEIDIDKINTSKTAVKYYHKLTHVKLLIRLIKSNKIKITKSDVITLFKKPPSLRNGRRRIFRSRNVSSEFKNNIVEYVKLVGSKFPTNTLIKKTFLANKMYTQIVDIINSVKFARSFNFNANEKLRIFGHIVKLDDLDRFKSLLDKKILFIEELHQDKYIIHCFELSPNTWKIARYILNTLNIRTTYFSEYLLSTATNDKLLKMFILIKESNAPLNNNLLMSVIKYQKSTKLIDFLINECGMKITNNHIMFLTYYSLKHFKKYTQGLKFNKEQIICKSINDNRTRNYHFHGDILCSNINVIMYLISLNKSKCNNTRYIKYCTMALLTGKTHLYEAIKKKFNVEPDLSIIKNLINDKFLPKPYKCYCTGIPILLLLADCNTIKHVLTEKNIYDLLNFANFEISSKFNFGYKYNTDQFKIMLENVDIKYSLEQLKVLISLWSYEICTKKGSNIAFSNALFLFFEKAMKSMTDNDTKNMIEFLCNERLYLCLATCVQNPYKYMTLNQVYGLLLSSEIFCYIESNVIDLILSFNKITLTSFIYELLFSSLCWFFKNDYEDGDELNVDKNIIDTLTTPPITQKTYDKFNYLEKLCKKHDRLQYINYRYIFDRIKTREIKDCQSDDHFYPSQTLIRDVDLRTRDWKKIFPKSVKNNKYGVIKVRRNNLNYDNLSYESSSDNELDFNVDKLVNDALNEAVIDNDHEYKQINQQ